MNTSKIKKIAIVLSTLFAVTSLSACCGEIDNSTPSRNESSSSNTTNNVDRNDDSDPSRDAMDLNMMTTGDQFSGPFGPNMDY